MSKPKQIAFLGLGMMGGPMAGHLLRAGHHVTAHNRTKARAEAWLDRFGSEGSARLAASPAEAAKDADIVISCVGNDHDLSQVLMGTRGALNALPEGGLIIDHTSVSVQIARQISVEAADRGLAFVDAPVSGGQSGAEQAALAIMCGGNANAVDAARPVMDAYAARIVHVGRAGAGQATKMVNQIAIAGILASLAEAVRFAQGARLDMDRVAEAISGGAAQSWQMDNRWATMANATAANATTATGGAAEAAEDEFDFGFAVDWMRKDLGNALNESRKLGVSLPVTALVDQFYAEVQAMGGGKNDASALIRRLPGGKSR